MSWLNQPFLPAALDLGAASIQSLAWPAAVFLIAAMFRAEVRLVLERLVRLKFQDFEAQFRRELQDSEGLATAGAPRRLLDLPSEARKVFHEVDGASTPAAKRAVGRPREVIADSWAELSEAADLAAGTVGGDPIRPLAERGVLAGPSLLLFERLRQLQSNLTLHGRWEPAPSDAARFAELAGPLAAQLRQVAPPEAPKAIN